MSPMSQVGEPLPPFSLVVRALPYSFSPSLWRGGQIIKCNHAVGLCPQTDFAVRIRLVMSVDQLLSVKRAGDVVAFGHYPQCVPLPSRDLRVCPSKLQPLAVDHAI